MTRSRVRLALILVLVFVMGERLYASRNPEHETLNDGIRKTARRVWPRMVDLAGVSMGGWVTGTVTSRHPERIRSLILVDPVAGKSGTSLGKFGWPLIGGYLFQNQAVPTMPAAEFHAISNAAHLPILERAAETDSLILAFLAKQPR